MRPALILFIICMCFASTVCLDNLFKFITVDTAPHDGSKRFLWGAQVYGIDVEVIKSPSSANNFSIVTGVIASLEYPSNILYCESKFLALAGTAPDIMKRWKDSRKDVLLDINLQDSSCHLNCILGNASNVLYVMKKLSAFTPSPTDTMDTIIQQVSYNSNISISQDENSMVFLKLDQFIDAVGYSPDRLKFVNFETNDTPPLLIGSLKSYNLFIRLTNHVPGIFDLEKLSKGKRVSKDVYKPWNFFRLFSDATVYYKEDESRYQTMVSALFIKEDVPLLDLVLNRFKSLQWLSKQRVILIFCRLRHRDHVVNNFIAKMKGHANYLEIKFFNSTTEETKTNLNMHEKVQEVCNKYNCSWIWYQDSDVMNIQGSTLQELAIFNVSIISPLTLSDLYVDNPRPNFWGDTTDTGFYRRSPDYFEIIQRKLAGLFAVPYISGAYLVKAEVMKELSYHDPIYKDEDIDIVFSNSVRKSGHFLFLKADRSDCLFVNGRTNSSVTHPFLEHFEENKTPFYLGFFMKWNHTRIRDQTSSDVSPIQNPCDDVYVMEIFTEAFTHNLKSAALSSDKWSFKELYKGWNVLETVSLDDLGFSKGWAAFSLDYIPTGLYRKFNGYQSSCSPLLSFVTKMTNNSKPTDSLEGRGVFTVLISLSDDIEAGSIIFNDNCKITLKIGDFLLFPSRLTHKIRFVPPNSGTVMHFISFYS